MFPDNTDLEKICRGCLSKQGDMRPLFGSCLDDMLRQIARVEVQAGDGLPDIMCLQCVLQVSRAFRFKQQCERSDATLRMYLTREIQKHLSMDGIQTSNVELNYCEDNSDTEKCLFILQGNEDDPNVGDDIENTTFELHITDDNIVTFTGEKESSNMETNHYLENKNLNTVKMDKNVENIKSNVEDIPSKGENNLSLELLDHHSFTPAKEKEILIDNHHFTKEANFAEDINMNNDEESPNEVEYEDNVHVDNDKSLTCVDCGITYKTMAEFSLHHETEHPESFKCPVCDKIFSKRRILNRHIKIHDPVKPHICKDCGKAFTENSNLTKHMKKHTGELRNIVGKPNLCSVCGKGFKWASSLSKHMNHHTKRKILNCPYCPKYYIESRTLNIHLRSHTGEKPFVCDICDKGFTQMCNLEKHLRVHTGEKPYVCPICGKGFTQGGYVTIHLRSHTGEKPYECSDCGKSFAGSNTLAIHRRTHTGERPYPCGVCGKAFARLETCIIHQRTHTGEKPHICKICQRGFSSSSHLSGHMRSHTGTKSYECKICNKKFSASSSLKVHVKSHLKGKSHDCVLCQKKFEDIAQLEEHQLTHDAILVYDDNKLEEVKVID